jgi:hypothetical protein
MVRKKVGDRISILTPSSIQSMTTHIQVKKPSHSFLTKLHKLVDEVDDICDYDNRKKSDTDVYEVLTKYYTFLQEQKVWEYALTNYCGTSFTCESILDGIASHKRQYHMVDGQPVTSWWFGKTEWGRTISDDFWNAMTLLEQSIQTHQKKALQTIVIPHKYSTRYQVLLNDKAYEMVYAIDDAIKHQNQYVEMVAKIDYYQYLTWFQCWRANPQCYKQLMRQLIEDEASFTSYRDNVGDLYYETTEGSRFDKLVAWSPFVKPMIGKFLRAVRELRKQMES